MALPGYETGAWESRHTLTPDPFSSIAAYTLAVFISRLERHDARRSSILHPAPMDRPDSHCSSLRGSLRPGAERGQPIYSDAPGLSSPRSRSPTRGASAAGGRT